MEFDNKLKPIYSNVGYHRGDLGRAEYLGAMRGRRGTGHFGTGTYFLGKPTTSGSYANRPEHRVDFSKYKLYKPANYEQGWDLHESLKAINNYAFDEEKVNEATSKLASIFGVDQNQIKEIFKTKVLPTYIQDLTYDQIYDKSLDTFSTQLVKALGYQGIDVRHIPELDNYGYGSVIYNLLDDSLIK